MRRKLAAGNWKMFGTEAAIAEVEALAAMFPEPACDILICPPATLISRMSLRMGGGAVAIGGQDCHPAPEGAHTGDISAAMLADAGATHVILGHSERRADHGETDALVADKARAALSAGLVPVICVGETLAEREAGSTLSVVTAQLQGSVPDGLDIGALIIAYEPVWAIGTGKVPGLAEIAEVHDFMRENLTTRFGPGADDTRLLYGGSVKPGNASDIFSVSNVDGALVGGASLAAADFGAIIAALAAS